MTPERLYRRPMSDRFTWTDDGRGLIITFPDGESFTIGKDDEALAAHEAALSERRK